MSNLIYFFIGLTIIISGDEIGSLIGYEYISLLCNIVGACFMAYSTKKYIDNMKETNRNNTEIQDKIQTVLNDILQLEANVITTMEEENGNLIEKVEKQIKEVNSLNEKLTKSNDEVNKIFSTIEKTSETEISKLENVIESVEGFGKLPVELLKSTEELSEKINAYMLNVTNEIKYLTQDIADQDKKLTKNINNTINEIEDIIEDNNEEATEQIKQLGQQYAQFEGLVEKLIQQMTLMSEKDYEVMKGFLNE